MFDIAWSELVVIGAVALVVIGPKDLPKALRSVGEMVGKVRRMASEFQGQFNDAMREAELHDLKKTVEDIGGSVEAATKVDFNPIQTIRDEIKGATESKPAADAEAEKAAMAAAEAKLADIPPPEPLGAVNIEPEPPAKKPRKAKAETRTEPVAVLEAAPAAPEPAAPESAPEPRAKAARSKKATA
jgi:sec-independent protein translocase protein TatB